MNGRRVGILGGTFDPPHLGHINLARAIGAHLRLEEVRLVLSASPPHKDNRNVTPAPLRWKMLCAALEGLTELKASDMECRRQEPSWTIRTVERLQREEPGLRLVFLTGSEGFLLIRTWREYRRLLTLLPFAILLRTPDDRVPVSRLIREEGWAVLTDPEDGWGGGGCLLLDLPCEHLDISSTRIRDAMGRGERDWARERVPEAVWNIMEKERLYGA